MAELYHLIDIGSEAALFLRLARRCNASGNSEVAACSRHISTFQCTPWKHPQAAGKHERFISSQHQHFHAGGRITQQNNGTGGSRLRNFGHLITPKTVR
jgi:hypothetical protein